MDTLIGAVIFIVMVVFALGKQVQDSRKKSEQLREREPLDRDKLPGSTRRILDGETGVREAKPRTPPGLRQEAPRQAEPRVPGRQLLESLLGASSEEESEGDWVPVQESAPRREVPRRVQGVREMPDTARRPAPPAARHQMTQQAPQQAPAAPQQTTQQAPRQAPKPAARRRSAAPERQEQPPRRPKVAQTKRRPAAAQKALRRAAQPAHRHRTIFGDIREVRKAIVFAEILGPPRAFTDLQGGPQ